MSRTIAIVGASNQRNKFGNKAVRAYLQAGYQVFPVHPTEKVIEGLPVYASVADIPETKLDRISVYLPPSVTLTTLSSFTSKTVGEIWLNPGTESADVLQRAQELHLPVISGCSIVDLGVSPSQFPDE